MTKSYATGGCLCGAVRYECSEAPLMTGACHCRACQRACGSAFATLMIFRQGTVSITGEGLSKFSHPGASGQGVDRFHCAKCASPVSAFYEVTPDFTVIHAGTLDDPALIKPQWNINTADKQPWLELSSHMKSFEGGYGSGENG